uniref:Uncharacterized protein n=1 Tax=Arundo donax TaxID=35708 RepID=A0A0A8ZR37_ARUDO
MITGDDGVEWCFTGLYGESHTGRKEETWRLLRTLNVERHTAWVCIGNFNEILCNEEKKGEFHVPKLAWIVLEMLLMCVA